MKPLAFEYLNQGKALQRANEAIRDALQNCLDPNTPLKSPRLVKLSVTVEPMLGLRERPNIIADVTTHLAEPQLKPQLAQVHLIKKVAHIEEEEEQSLFEYEPIPLSADQTPTLEYMNEGQVLAEFNYALQQVVENVINPDTPSKGKRAAKCVIKFTNLEESAKRGPIQTAFSVTTTLKSRVISPAIYRMAAPVVSESDYPTAYDETAIGKEATQNV